ncbi:MAG TPA: glycosyltransferase family 4 protein [Rudaea sp.]|nr:glycosyltransferase family 4 protein [Rudaea sp.]
MIAALRPPAARQRILMTGDTVGGVWQYALELAGALTARGHEVAFATMGRLPDRVQRREAAAIAGLELYPSEYKLLWMPESTADVHAAGEWLMGLAADVQPTVVHLNDFGHAHLPWPAPVLLVAHSCVLSWWYAVHGAPAPEAWAEYARTVAAALAAANLVVAPTHAMLAALERHYGRLRGARIIPNARGTGAGDRVKERIVFSAGRVGDAGKNMETLARAAARLSWPVCIAGDPRRADGSEVALDNVTMLGRLSSAEVRRWFARAPIYALPARYEPFGLSVLEAAQAACALVLGDIESLRENWHGAAVFVPPADELALVRAIERLIGDAALRADFAARARLRAERFAPATMADAYVRAYADILIERQLEVLPAA